MRSNLVVPGIIVLVLGFLGMFDGATADTQRAGYPTGLSKNESDTVKTVVTRTVGWSRYYGRRIYRCRHFSSECYHYRPTHYVRHWSYSYRNISGNQPSGATGLVAGIATGRETHTPKLGHYYVDSKTLKSGIFTKAQNTSDKIYRGQKVTAYEVSGGFARITSPGRSTRWVRAVTLSTSGVSSKP